MLLITETVQVTVEPPPLPEPLHWSTVVISSGSVVVTGAVSPPAQAGEPVQSLATVSVELVVVSLRLLTMITLHSTTPLPALIASLH